MKNSGLNKKFALATFGVAVVCIAAAYVIEVVKEARK